MTSKVTVKICIMLDAESRSTSYDKFQKLDNTFLARGIIAPITKINYEGNSFDLSFTLNGKAVHLTFYPRLFIVHFVVTGQPTLA